MNESQYLESDKSKKVRNYKIIENSITRGIEALDRLFDDDQEFTLVITQHLADYKFKRNRKYVVTVKPIGEWE